MSTQQYIVASPAKLAIYGTGILVGGAVIGYYIGLKLADKRVNHLVKIGVDKVVDSFDVEDLGNKKVFCRCWKSSKFPYCDGRHNEHNKCTNDNLGPLIITNSKSA